ncbi:MAG: CBS domain-containing protein [Acidobacteriota bacterium]|nr:CBS domain-containing protein [Acidobacteriota bacterium]
MSCCSDKMEPLKSASCCTPNDTAQHASHSMRDTGCGCSPVVEDKQTRKLVGVVTERDVVHKVAAEGRAPSEVQVADIMSPVSACCGVEASLEEAKRKLHEHNATSLPVVDAGGSCCGTISVHQV